jgi:hypothetical protein
MPDDDVLIHLPIGSRPGPFVTDDELVAIVDEMSSGCAAPGAPQRVVQWAWGQANAEQREAIATWIALGVATREAAQ